MAIQIKVLHVDDDQLFLETSKELLLEIAKDVSIDIASNVDEALKKVTAEKYDAIISDYDMPIKNGLDFVKNLRENNITTPFILFTGKGREDVAIQALNLGVDHYLNKQGAPEAVYKELALSIHALNEKAKATKLLTQHKGLPIESMPAAVAIIDFNGVFIDGNHNLEIISGFKKEELIGKNVFTLNFTSQEAFAEIAQNISEVLTGNKCSQPVEYSFTRKDGTLVSVEFSAFPVIRDDDPAILCQINDISERKKTREKIKMIFKSLPIPTYTWEVIEDDFILIDYNEAALNLTQGFITKYIGTTTSKMYGRDHPIFKDLVECSKTRTQFSKKMQYTFQSTSRQHYLDVKYVFVPPNLIIVHTEDITERKEAEDALIESEEKYRMIAEKMQDVITVTDAMAFTHMSLLQQSNFLVTNQTKWLEKTPLNLSIQKTCEVLSFQRYLF
jgi:PAS domain S-box-containing protein